MRYGHRTPQGAVDLQEITAAQLMRYREQYRDGAIDCEIASAPPTTLCHFESDADDQRVSTLSL